MTDQGPQAHVRLRRGPFQRKAAILHSWGVNFLIEPVRFDNVTIERTLSLALLIVQLGTTTPGGTQRHFGRTA
jgi:hypothetical protein